MRTRDSQRSKVVRALWRAPSESMARPDLVRLCDRLLKTKWFTRNFRGWWRDADDIVFRWAKSRRALCYGLAWRFRLNEHGLHEKGAAHGREFCAAFLVFVRKIEGAETARAVRQAFAENRVRYTRPRAPREMTELAKAGLRARLDGIRAKAEAVPTAEPAGERCVRCGRAYILGDPFTSHALDCQWYGVE